MSTAPLTILNRDYLAIVHEAAGEASKSVQHCAAKLIQIFERLMLWKLETCKLPLERAWFWIPIFRSQQPTELDAEQLELIESGPRSLYDELNGEHCKDVIQKALRLLVDNLGLLHRRRDPRNGQNRTFQYLTDLERLNELKASFSEASQKSSLKRDKTSLKDDISSLKREISRMISSTNSSSFSSSNNNAAEGVVLGEREETDPIEPIEPSTTTPVERPTPEVYPCSSVQGVAEDPTSPPPAAVDLKIDWNDDVQEAVRKFGDRVSNALEYVRQGVEEGWAKQPTGLFIAALRKGRKPSKKAATPKAAERVNLFQVEQACQMAWTRKERSFIQAKLQWLAGLGMTAEVEGLCDRHPEWGFQLKGGSYAAQS